LAFPAGFQKPGKGRLIHGKANAAKLTVELMESMTKVN
jgi:hypothetical protein